MKTKKILAGLLAGGMVLSMAGCGEKDNRKVIKLMAFTKEVPQMVEEYMRRHPEEDKQFKVETTIVATDGGAYQTKLDAMLIDPKNAPDIYVAEAAFVLKYAQGDFAQYAAAYKDLGIDVDNKIQAAEIAQYTVDIGKRGNDVVALGYQSTGGAFIYRASIAKDAFGTDDPAEIEKIIGANSGNWDKYWEAAETLKAKGYAVCSGDGDMWHAIENSSDKGWIVDGALVIDSKRESLLDVSKKLVDNGFHHDSKDWEASWFADMKEDGKTFGFFGPAWLINYTLNENCQEKDGSNSSFGDWRVCASPVGFFWGGSWIMSSKGVADKDIKDEVANIISWITLDCTKDGLQYLWANGSVDWDQDPKTATTKDVVASNVVLKMSDGKLDFLGGQNMFDAFVAGNKNAKGDNLTQYDEDINTMWRDQVRAYAHGEKSRDEAIEAFQKAAKDKYKLK